MIKPITTARPEDLLAWYDAHARDLPWRIGPADSKAGIRPDPYRVWLSEVMLQQTTVRTVGPYFDRFTARWPDIHALAAAPRDDILSAWAGLGYYARARNLHACAERIVRDHGGKFPDTEAALLSLPGIGAYTAAAIAAIAFDQPATVVDGNVERVIARLFAEDTPLPRAKTRLRQLAGQLTPKTRPGDYAQAMMDLGATICTPSRPGCAACPWQGDCRAHALDLVGSLPRREARRPKPIRHGIAWVVLDKNARVLTERREDQGLLGGMLAVPGTDWLELAPGKSGETAVNGPPETASPDEPDESGQQPPLAGQWQSAGEVRHVFTHFHLRLEVRLLQLAREGGPDFLPHSDAIAAMPTVFAKAVRLAVAESEARDTA